jgi:hypothetical protein
MKGENNGRRDSVGVDVIHEFRAHAHYCFWCSLPLCSKIQMETISRVELVPAAQRTKKNCFMKTTKNHFSRRNCTKMYSQRQKLRRRKHRFRLFFVLVAAMSRRRVAIAMRCIATR